MWNKVSVWLLQWIVFADTSREYVWLHSPYIRVEWQAELQTEINWHQLIFDPVACRNKDKIWQLLRHISCVCLFVLDEYF